MLLIVVIKVWRKRGKHGLQWMSLHRVVWLVQVDVEGCELEVLQGVQAQDWVNIKQVHC